MAADWMPQTALHIRCFASLRLSAWSIQRFWEIPLHRLPGKKRELSKRAYRLSLMLMNLRQQQLLQTVRGNYTVPAQPLRRKCTGCWNLRIILLIFRFRLRMIRKQDGRFREQQIIRWKMRHWRFLPCAFCSSSIRQHFPVILLNSSFIQA